ncbi:glycoside hydrolase [Fistulina hepatica ATCC 64428]|uniref:Glycoside hydrolase n=1 Tax=Fistulina hepatica ATCC 64428 TaxID=1128425 RepID=A0A0D7A0D1_9AGAR|nr:glycoside hydrolase [Fistulina hepatica ATCC 64428]
MIENYGSGGLNLDFEYPSSTAQGQGFVDLYTELRSALDSLAQGKGDTTPYQLTAAVAASSTNSKDLILSSDVPQAYDYSGSCIAYNADVQANLYGGSRTRLSTDSAIKGLVNRGVRIGKLVMGIPLYSRAFENTDGLGDPYM